MNCFVHPEMSAIALCKFCNKGTCKTCALETDAGIACSDKCQVEILDSYKMMDRAKSLYGIGSKKSLPVSIFYQIALGLGFLIFAGTIWYRRGNLEPALFEGFLGLVFLSFGLYKLFLDKTGMRC